MHAPSAPFRTVLAALLLAAIFPALSARPVTILPLGASITEGGGKRFSYRMPLWELLVGHGYLVEFVGSRSSEERIGSLRHEGHSGSPAEYLAEHIGEIYRANPADIVLLHAGHNHSTEERPVDGIVAATRRILDEVRQINPAAIVLVAQPALSGKLPKYDYLPELNRALGEFARADRAAHAGDGLHPVVLVDQTPGFDWRVDTLPDRVHPNAGGARKIARRWFEVLRTVLHPPEFPVPEPERRVYRRVGGQELTLDIFQPPGEVRRPAPAIVYFFAGGWRRGTPVQFYRECARLAACGLVAISADYRIEATGGTPFDGVADAKAAISWVRAHARELGVDPARVAAAGASAGGHLAAATAFVPGFDDPAAGQGGSCRPDALVLLYPVLDTGAAGSHRDQLGDRGAEISPLEHVAPPAPPTVVLVGDRDPVVSLRSVELFQDRIEGAGGRCEVHVYPGGGHPLWSYRAGENAVARDVADRTEAFLRQLGWVRRIPR